MPIAPRTVHSRRGKAICDGRDGSGAGAEETGKPRPESDGRSGSKNVYDRLFSPTRGKGAVDHADDSGQMDRMESSGVYYGQYSM